MDGDTSTSSYIEIPSTSLYLLPVSSTFDNSRLSEVASDQQLRNNIDTNEKQLALPAPQEWTDTFCNDKVSKEHENDIPLQLMELQSFSTRKSQSDVENEKTIKCGSSCSEKIKTEDNMENTLTIKSFVHISDRVVLPRAFAVLPPALRTQRNCVYPQRTLPPFTRFGPVQGHTYRIFIAEANELISESVIKNSPIFFMKKEKYLVTYIDVTDKDKSNWFSLLPLGTQETANVWLYEESELLYGITTKCIKARTPLLLGYSKIYAQMHKLPVGLPILDLIEIQSEQTNKFSCNECSREFESSSLLQRHVDIDHKVKKIKRMRYRCRYCSLTYATMFSLKRHLKSFCLKKTTKPTEMALPQEGTSKINLDEFLNVDDNKLPSDESLQNYTNGLDFSTNLFDTDRIPNLDISGSSKSDNDFNSFSVNDATLSLGKFTTSSPGFAKDKKTREIRKKDSTSKVVLVECPYCKQNVSREKKPYHLRICSARRLQCECGRSFTDKDSLAEHINIVHLGKDSHNYPDHDKQSQVEQYKCEKCQTSFKRRGMLVNHLWQKHNTKSSSIPLERRVRHYLCPACPKLYRTAAKCELHLRKHHPETKSRPRPIEAGRQQCAPAACPNCPRQYVTRAKLLQHIRSHHGTISMKSGEER